MLQFYGAGVNDVENEDFKIVRIKGLLGITIRRGRPRRLQGYSLVER